jgi:hypothetical protein
MAVLKEYFRIKAEEEAARNSVTPPPEPQPKPAPTGGIPATGPRAPDEGGGRAREAARAPREQSPWT